MITLSRAAYQTEYRTAEFNGLSSDVKPIYIELENGSTFYEIDTGDYYAYDKENGVWVKQN